MLLRDLFDNKYINTLMLKNIYIYIVVNEHAIIHLYKFYTI